MVSTTISIADFAFGAVEAARVATPFASVLGGAATRAKTKTGAT